MVTVNTSRLRHEFQLEITATGLATNCNSTFFKQITCELYLFLKIYKLKILFEF